MIISAIRIVRFMLESPNALAGQTVDENLKVSAERLVDQVSLTRHRSCSLSPDLVNAANGAKFQKERGAMDDK